MTGFTSYNKKKVAVKPTTAEIVATLSSEQKVGVLNSFCRKTKAVTAASRLLLDAHVVSHLYGKFKAIEIHSKLLMRGEELIVPAEVNEAGEVTKEAVYNVPVKTITLLKELVVAKFSEDFTEGQTVAIVNKMVAYSKSNGQGTFAYYKLNVTS